VQHSHSTSGFTPLQSTLISFKLSMSQISFDTIPFNSLPPRVSSSDAFKIVHKKMRLLFLQIRYFQMMFLYLLSKDRNLKSDGIKPVKLLSFNFKTSSRAFFYGINYHRNLIVLVLVSSILSSNKVVIT